MNSNSTDRINSTFELYQSGQFPEYTKLFFTLPQELQITLDWMVSVWKVQGGEPTAQYTPKNINKQPIVEPE